MEEQKETKRMELLLCASKEMMVADNKKVSHTNKTYTRLGMEKLGIVRIPKKNNLKKNGKRITKIGIATLPIPFSGSVAFIFIGSCMLLVADVKKIRIKIIRFKGKSKRTLRLIKVRMRVY